MRLGKFVSDLGYSHIFQKIQPLVSQKLKKLVQITDEDGSDMLVLTYTETTVRRCPSK